MRMLLHTSFLASGQTIADAVRAEGLTYLTEVRLSRIEREIARAFALKIPGDFVEFGVALGGSAILLARAATKGCCFHGFDRFGVIPPPASAKDDEKSRQRYEIIRSGRSVGINGAVYYGYRADLLEEVRENLERYGVPPNGSSVQLHKGLFSDTWPALRGMITQIALVHIDCDWYDPVAYCLAAVADMVASGGAIIVDDYNDYGGCRTAVLEFLAARSDFVICDNESNLVLRRHAIEP